MTTEMTSGEVQPRYYVEGNDVYERKFTDEDQVFAQCCNEGDAHRVAETLSDLKARVNRSWQFGAETVAKSFFRMDGKMVYVSTIKPFPRRVEDEFAPPPETCAWTLDADDCRDDMIFGPERHVGDDLVSLHAECVQAIKAGHAYVSGYREATHAE